MVLDTEPGEGLKLYRLKVTVDMKLLSLCRVGFIAGNSSGMDQI